MFSRSIEFDTPYGTFYMGPQAILTNTVELIRAFFLRPERLLKTQFFEKKGKISSEKNIVAYFSSYYRV